MKRFKKEKIYPNEAFIQESIEKHFRISGYEIQEDGQIDLIAENDNEKWVIEAKGLTSQITVDFNTCIGQLAKSMQSNTCNYALALPSIEKFKTQCMKLPDYYRERNNLYIIVVNEKQEVNIIKPTESIKNNW